MKIFLDTVGCRLNLSEIEIYARQFRAAGHTLVADPNEADLAVVNTCTVTAAAASDSRGKIRRAARFGAGEIVVTGCWATLDPEKAAELPMVSQIISNPVKDNLVEQVLQVSPGAFDLEPIIREPLPGSLMRTRAFIKVQDGCDSRCTFCVTTLARGNGRSHPMSQVLSDVRAAIRGGTKEAVLSGVHLGSWGQDLEPQRHLKHLVETVLTETGLPRLRLSSLEPWDLNDGFFTLWRDPRLARHLHLPLQSGCASTLRRMARKTTPEAFAKLVDTARTLIPQVAITTDVIVGFPGESEAEFIESLEFVRQCKFARGHVFTYSARPGTAAASMPDQVPHPVRKRRNAEMRAVFAQSSAAYQTLFLGQKMSVLWESAIPQGEDSWTLSGLTDNYLRVKTRAPTRIWNAIVPVILTKLTSTGIQGQLG